MSFDFKLPDIGEGVVEGEIVEWLVKEGDTVAEDQPLVAVMTDKATVEIPSPKKGKVVKLGGKPGEIVKVGAMLVSLDTGNGSAGTPTPAKAESAPAKAAPPAPQKQEATAPPKAQQPAAAPAQAEAPAKPAARIEAAPAPAMSESAQGEDDERLLASPATRKLARESGIDLSSLEGSGPRGRITREDVEAAADKPKPRAVATPAAATSAATAAAKVQAEAAPQALLAMPRHSQGPVEHVEDRIPLRGLRKKIAERMIESKTKAAHFAYVDHFDATELVELRKRLKAQAEKYGVNLTYLPIIAKALVPCLKEFPLLNASLDDQTGELVLKHYYGIGIAVDTDKGLTVPVVQDVDRKSILEIAAEMTELSERARASRSKLEDFQGGTFTITSTGNIGGLFATPVINYPEVAILGVPRIKQLPWVVDGQVVVRDVLHLAISLDHRVVDGAVGARFMNRLIEYLVEPSRLFLEMA
jgi:pyruvate dehydrogenase E2 component (dihydrolipoamide acetyltransferase)